MDTPQLILESLELHHVKECEDYVLLMEEANQELTPEAVRALRMLVRQAFVFGAFMEYIHPMEKQDAH